MAYVWGPQDQGWKRWKILTVKFSAGYSINEYYIKLDLGLENSVSLTLDYVELPHSYERLS